jgi:hypothetical protein
MHLTPQVIVLELSLILTKTLQYQSISRILSPCLLRVNTIHHHNNNHDQKICTTSLLDIYIIQLLSPPYCWNPPSTVLRQLQDLSPCLDMVGTIHSHYLLFSLLYPVNKTTYIARMSQRMLSKFYIPETFCLFKNIILNSL